MIGLLVLAVGVAVGLVAFHAIADVRAEQRHRRPPDPAGHVRLIRRGELYDQDADL